MSEEKKTDNYTDGQRRAINTFGKTLLVSAAAGSGKTFTLIERIVKSVFYAENPLNIEDMLIVTFTRSAAEELRDRLKKKFAKTISELPPDPRNERQLIMLECAKICTIDSFCADFLRSNCEQFDLTPNFRVPDEAEISVLAENLLGGMFSEIYEGNMPEIASPEELFELCDCLTDTGRQNDLEAIIFKIYDDTQTSEEGILALDRLIEEYDPERFCSVEKTFLGSYCIDRVREVVAHYLPIYEETLQELLLRENPKLDALAAQTAECLDLIKALGQESEYTKIRELLLGADFSARAVSCRDKTLPDTTKLRGALRSDIESLRERFFIYTEQDWRTSYRGLYRMLNILLRVVKGYDKVFKSEKRRRGICEYTDIERYTYEALWQDGKLTDAAVSERAKYSCVYIDEYQDVNNLQNKIFEAISSETNRFMVGDIKQSIYRFRSANPEIFAGMKKTFPPIEQAENSTRAAIFMSDNFRCDRGIVDFVNIIFNKIFSCIKDSVGYTERDALSFAKVKSKDPEPEYRKPEICLIDSSSVRSACRNAGIESTEKLLTPAAVAEKIRELLATGKKNNGAPIQPQDIAIIMRSAKGRSMQYKEALERLGIPCELAEQTSFFDGPEIRLALCLLNSVDNPHKDIYLSGLMLSPLYSFTPDELILIRQAKGDSLYSSLISYTDENPDYERGKRFIDALEKYRLLAEGTPTDRLIMRLYQETGLLALGARLGEQKKLIQLYEYARSYENSSFRGLYSFIHYVNNITDRKHSLDKREAPRSDRAVSIMTAHGSKGLEFPVVFYVDSERIFGGQRGGTPPRFEYAEGFGFGMVLRTPSGLSLVNNPTREIIKDYRRRKNTEEEIRVLYVALTRAMERLYIVAMPGKKTEAFLSDVDFLREHLTEHTVYSVNSILPLLLAAHKFEIKSPEEFLSHVPSVISDPVSLTVGEGASGKSGTGADVIPKITSREERFRTEGHDTESSADKKGEKSDTPSDFGPQRVGARFTEGCTVGLNGACPAINTNEKSTEDNTPLLSRFNFKYPNEALSAMPKKLSVSVLYPEILDGTEQEATPVYEMKRDRAALRFSSTGLLPKFITKNEKPTAAEQGTATHLFMQFADYGKVMQGGAKAELDRLVREKFISEKDGKILRLDELEAFAKSELIRQMSTAKKVWRELRFNVKLPAVLFTRDEKTKEALQGRELLVQGVIDCLIENSDGTLRLVDYKTDRLTAKERENPSLAEEKLRQTHSEQLYYYSLAVEKMFGKRPDSCEVYSTALGRCVTM